MENKTAVLALAALAQETRLAVFRVLVQQGESGLAAGEIAQGLGLAPATLSFHLKELAHAGLVIPRHDGRYIYYAADYGAMNRLLDFLTENCCAADGTDCAPGTVCAPASKRPNTSRKVKR